MHRSPRTRDASTENLANTLMSKTDAQNWQAAGDLADDSFRYSRVTWCAGPRGDDHCARIELRKLAHGDRVVSHNLSPLTKPMEIPGYVENEGVVVVDDDNQGPPCV